MMKALVWMVVGGACVFLWNSPPAKKFVDDISVAYCSNYYDIQTIPMPDKKESK